MSTECDEYIEQVIAGTLPVDFEQWGLTGKHGWTVAHAAAYHGHLPVGFNQWGLSDNKRGTVAHMAARHGNLPADFDQWGIANKDGYTVAHEAAHYGRLPVSFSQWSLNDSRGLTVLGQLLIAAKSNKFVSRWREERPLCKTDADWIVFKKELPEIYQKYTINGYMPDVDNDQEASQEALQEALL
jgi:hypothetical protein